MFDSTALEIISRRVRGGERPSVVLREFRVATPELSLHDLASMLRQAFPDSKLYIVEYVWKWREQEHSPDWDAWFDFGLIGELLYWKVELPWTEADCERELDRVRPVIEGHFARERQAELEAQSFENLKKDIEALEGRVACVEALWDGLPSGWFIDLSVIMASDGQMRECFLARISDGGDIRLFNGEVPPWPEAVRAAEVGGALARHFGAEFYFPEPERPEYAPRWLELKQAQAKK